MKSYAYDIWFMTKLYTLEQVYCLVSKLCRESRLLVSNFMSRITLFWSHILTPKKLDCATKPTFVRSALEYMWRDNWSTCFPPRNFWPIYWYTLYMLHDKIVQIFSCYDQLDDNHGCSFVMVFLRDNIKLREGLAVFSAKLPTVISQKWQKTPLFCFP